MPTIIDSTMINPQAKWFTNLDTTDFISYFLVQYDIIVNYTKCDNILNDTKCDWECFTVKSIVTIATSSFHKIFGRYAVFI